MVVRPILRPTGRKIAVTGLFQWAGGSVIGTLHRLEHRTTPGSRGVLGRLLGASHTKAKKTKESIILGWAPPLPPSSYPGRRTISSSSPHSSRGAKPTILPTLVFHRKVGAAGVACSSWKSSPTVGCFRSQAFPTLSHNSRIWGPRPALNEDVVTSLSLAATTPTCAGADCVGHLGEIKAG